MGAKRRNTEPDVDAEVLEMVRKKLRGVRPGPGRNEAPKERASDLIGDARDMLDGREYVPEFEARGLEVTDRDFALLDSMCRFHEDHEVHVGIPDSTAPVEKRRRDRLLSNVDSALERWLIRAGVLGVPRQVLVTGPRQEAEDLLPTARECLRRAALWPQWLGEDRVLAEAAEELTVLLGDPFDPERGTLTHLVHAIQNDRARALMGGYRMTAVRLLLEAQTRHIVSQARDMADGDIVKLDPFKMKRCLRRRKRSAKAVSPPGEPTAPTSEPHTIPGEPMKTGANQKKKRFARKKR